MKRIIKYAALFFALILSASIIGGCLSAGVVVVRMIAEKTGNMMPENGREDIWYRNEAGDVVFLGINFSNSGGVKSGTEEFSQGEISSMDLDVGSVQLIVDSYDGDMISINYENIPTEYKIFVENGTLKIKQTETIVFFGITVINEQKIHMRIPASMTFENVMVSKGSGRLVLSDVTTKKLSVSGGSGGVTVSDCSAERSELSSGSGSFTVHNCELGETSLGSGSGSVNLESVTAKNLVLDSGSGRVDISGNLTGNCMFDSGSGSVNVLIHGKEEEYNIRTDKGSGGFYLNGNKENDSHIEHAGADHLLVFETGSGKVSVQFR